MTSSIHDHGARGQHRSTMTDTANTGSAQNLTNAENAVQRSMVAFSPTAFNRGARVAIYKIVRGWLAFEGWATIRCRLDIPGHYTVLFETGGPLSDRWVYPGAAQVDPEAFVTSVNCVRTALALSMPCVHCGHVSAD